MDDKLKKKWVNELRSGKYEQGKSYLKNGNSYCCLGVLADIMGEEWVGYDSGSVYVASVFGNTGQNKNFIDAEILPIKFQYELAELNDLGYSFTEIADYIESGVEPNLLDCGEEKDD